VTNNGSTEQQEDALERRRVRRARLFLVALACTVIGLRLGTGTDDAAANSATSTDAHPAIDIATLDNIPVETWGVSGQIPGQTQTPTLQVLVWDIQQAGDRIFVGGGFLNVQEHRDAAPIGQPYLAAFDLDTGAWVDTCTPQFDRAVYALTVNSSGRLLVGGEFTSVNGQHREGLVALDPATCDVDSEFEGSVERPWSTRRAVVRELEIIGDDLYAVGNFSHVLGPAGQRVRMYKATRMHERWGTIDSQWRPEVTGSGVWGLAVDPGRNRVHFTGYFTSVNGVPGSGYFHTVDTATGASVAGLTPLPRNYPRGQLEMFDVAMGENLVFVAGEQHIVQVLDAQNHDMDGFHHTGNRGCGDLNFDYCRAFSGGAYQVAERIGDVVFSGCHCTRATRNGVANHFSSYSQERSALKVIFAYDASTGALIESFDPDATVRMDGAWAVASDTNGCLYVGGDYDNRGVRAQLGSWAGGFVKMCPIGWTPPQGGDDPDPGGGAGNPANPVGPDTRAPSTPENLTATNLGGGNVELTWDPSTDNIAVGSYLVYRNGSYIGWTPTDTTTYTDMDRPNGLTYTYQLRAVDTAGNRSPKATPAIIALGAPDTEVPTTPENLTATDLGGGSVELTWDPSTDNIAVGSYLVYRNGGYIGWVPADTTTYTDTGRTNGLTYTYQLRAVDTASNRSPKAIPAIITLAP